MGLMHLLKRQHLLKNRINVKGDNINMSAQLGETWLNRRKEARAIAKHVRMTPRKLRLVVDLIRGKDVKEAKHILRFVPKHGAKVIEKVLNSAVANAENEPYKMDAENLYISTAAVDQGPALKRWIPRAQGRASAIKKRTSHVTIKVCEREEKEVREKKSALAGVKTKEKKTSVKANMVKDKAGKVVKDKAETLKKTPKKGIKTKT